MATAAAIDAATATLKLDPKGTLSTTKIKIAMLQTAESTHQAMAMDFKLDRLRTRRTIAARRRCMSGGVTESERCPQRTQV